MQAVFIEESTENLFPNPVAATTVTGWNTGANRTRTRITSLSPGLGLDDITTGIQVSASADISGGPEAAWAPITLPEADTYTPSFYVYVPSTWTGGNLRLSTASNGFAGATGDTSMPIDMDIRNDWQRVAMTFTADAGDLDGSIGVGVESGGWVSGQSLIFTAAQLEQKDHATSFVIGSRDAGAITLDATDRLTVDRGEIIVKFRTGHDVQRTGYVLAHSAGTDNRLYVYHTGGELRYGIGAAANRFLAPIEAETWYTVSIAWDSGRVSVYIDGFLVEYRRDYSGFTRIDTTLELGHLVNNSHLNGHVGGVAAFDHVLSDAERMALLGQHDWTWAGLREPVTSYTIPQRTISVLGDLHLGYGDDTRSDTAFADLATLTDQQAYRIYVGDVVDDPDTSGSTPGAYDIDFLARADALDPDRDTWDIAIGNHDMNADRTADEWAVVYGYEDQNFVRDLGYCRVIYLGADDPINGPNATTLSAETVEWLDDRLAEDRRDALIISHGPLRRTVYTNAPGGAATGGFSSINPNFWTNPNDDVLAVLDRHPHAKAWVTGHTHARFEAVGSFTRHWTGTRHIAHINACAIDGATMAGEDVRSLFMTVLDDRLVLRIRNHTDAAWDTLHGRATITVPFDTPPTPAANPAAFVFSLNNSLDGETINGASTLTLIGSPGFTTIDGQYALDLSDTSHFAQISASGLLLPEQGSLVVRLAFADNGNTSQYAAFHNVGTDNRLYLNRNGSTKNTSLTIGAGQVAASSYQVADDEVVTLAADWDGEAAHLRVNGQDAGSTGYRGLLAFGNPLRFGGSSAGTSAGAKLLGVAGFRRMLTDHEHRRIANANSDEWSMALTGG